MSQRDVEGTLGRLVTDTAFRVRFFTQPETTAAREGFHLSRPELSQLERVPMAAVLELAAHIDGTLRRYEPPGSPSARA